MWHFHVKDAVRYVHILVGTIATLGMLTCVRSGRYLRKAKLSNWVSVFDKYMGTRQR